MNRSGLGAFKAKLSEERNLLILLSVSFALRAVLAAGGGQFFWADEARYYRSCYFLDKLLSAEFDRALNFLLTWIDHTGFIPAGVPAAAFHKIIMKVFSAPFERTLWAPALALSTASVACIALVHRIAIRAGAEKSEALLAAGLLACTNSFFYYSRHLMPYDVSFAMILSAIYIGLAPSPGLGRPLLGGLLPGLAFLTYNGNWIGCIAACAVHLLRNIRPPRERITRALALALGFIGPAAFLEIASQIRGFPSYFERLAFFSRLIKEDFVAESWNLPWVYFWHAEHFLAVAWAAGLIAAVKLAAAGRLPERGKLWLWCAAGVYALLTVWSTFLPGEILVGRGIRQLAPFFCLTTAAVVPKSIFRRPKLAAALALALAAQTAFNFKGPLKQAWPYQALVMAGPGAACGATVEGPDSSTRDPYSCSLAWKPWKGFGERFVLLNAWSPRHIKGPLKAPEGKILFRTPHPMQYRPYLYEGCSQRERDILLNNDISMRLVDTGR